MCALIFGCAPKIETEKDEKPIEQPIKQIVSREDAMRSLPCFGCHSYNEFAAMPERGIFSHQLHSDMGYHCNQCHDVRGHESVVINKATCASCHNLGEMVISKTALPARFNHAVHADVARCIECHPNLFLMSKGTAYITMKDIFEGRSCGACHDGKRAFPASDCARCHNVERFDAELTYIVEGIGNVRFSHRFHAAAFGCADCHPKLFGMKKTRGKMPKDEMYKGRYCGACHNGNIASPMTDCMKCHKAS
jgi:c(7)-type cytochrome triheme protein